MQYNYQKEKCINLERKMNLNAYGRPKFDKNKQMEDIFCSEFLSLYFKFAFDLYCKVNRRYVAFEKVKYRK
jgi:hypothetical protein